MNTALAKAFDSAQKRGVISSTLYPPSSAPTAPSAALTMDEKMAGWCARQLAADPFTRNSRLQRLMLSDASCPAPAGLKDSTRRSYVALGAATGRRLLGIRVLSPRGAPGGGPKIAVYLRTYERACRSLGVTQADLTDATRLDGFMPTKSEEKSATDKRARELYLFVIKSVARNPSVGPKALRAARKYANGSSKSAKDAKIRSVLARARETLGISIRPGLSTAASPNITINTARYERKCLALGVVPSYPMFYSKKTSPAPTESPASANLAAPPPDAAPAQAKKAPVLSTPTAVTERTRREWGDGYTVVMLSRLKAALQRAGVADIRLTGELLEMLATTHSEMARFGVSSVTLGPDGVAFERTVITRSTLDIGGHDGG